MQTNRHGKLKGLVKLRGLSKFKIYGLDNDQNICKRLFDGKRANWPIHFL